MPELTREEKLKLVEKLPQRLKDFLYFEDTGAFLLYIGNKYKLPDEKISMLSKIVGNIILGITSLPSLGQEVISKVTADAQIAANIAQEINNDLLVPVLMPVPTIPIAPPAPMPETPRPVVPVMPIPQMPSADKYRESANGMPARQLPESQTLAGGPEIIDLRKTPPPPMQMPVSAAPIPPRPTAPLTFTRPIERPKEPISMPHYIEADPHKTPISVPMPKVEISTPSSANIEVEPVSLPEVKQQTNLETQKIDKTEPPAAPKFTAPLTFTRPIEKAKESAEISEEERKPQFIFRPPGLAPTDLPHDVLDLRKDKGEF